MMNIEDIKEYVTNRLSNVPRNDLGRMQKELSQIINDLGFKHGVYFVDSAMPGYAIVDIDVLIDENTKEPHLRPVYSRG